jgi:hypothetical protein
MKRENFASKLFKKLQPLGRTTIDSFSDNSCTWIELKVEDKTLYFEFDEKKENITNISLHEDVIQIVDEKLIFRTERK